MTDPWKPLVEKTEPAPRQGPGLSKDAKAGIGIAAIVGLVVLLFAWNALSGGSGSTPSPPTFADYQGQVQEVCHNQVKALLKAPSTAQFSGDVVTGSNPRFTDLGHVDSQNSFGAMLGSDYTCTAIHGQGVNYQVRVEGLR